MKVNSIIVLLGLFLAFSSCNKDILPDQEMLEGTWIGIEASTGTELEFTIREMFLTKEGQSTAQYYYAIRNNSLYLYPDKINDPDHFTTHAIYLNEKSEELRIRGLGGSISNDDGFAVFVRQ
jgi:hypothetical protein